MGDSEERKLAAEMRKREKKSQKCRSFFLFQVNLEMVFCKE